MTEPVPARPIDPPTLAITNDPSSPLAEAAEVGFVECFQIELRFTILCLPWTGSSPWLRRHAQVIAATNRPGLELHPPPEPDEVDPGVMKDAQHQMLSVWVARLRDSQMRKNVRTTKIAVTIEAARPASSVTAKPCTGPVPNW